MRTLFSPVRNSSKRNRISYQTLEEFENTFWSKVIAGENNCIIWVGHKDKDGYGGVRHPIKRKQQRANRVAYELFFKKDPGHLQVLHKCDNPSCVNPHHLWLGTNLDNRRDSLKKGRIKRGLQLPHTKLSDSDKDSIKEMIAMGKTQQSVAAIFKVSQTHVGRIANNK